MVDKIYSITKEALTEFQTKMKTWVRSVTPTKTSDLDNDSDFLDQLALADIVALNFSASSTYAVGEYVIYEKKLYRCTTAVQTAGDWSSSNWTQVKSTDIFSGSSPGLVPAAESGDADKVLKGDGTWGEAGSSVRVSYDPVMDELHMDFSPPTVIKVGGRDYPFVQTGNQFWLAEDLKLTWTGLQHTNTGSWVDSPSYTTYSEYPDEIYYNYHAVNDLTNNHSDLLPDGWHVPSESEFQTLMDNSTHLALKSTTGWNPAGTNESGFNMYPVGEYSGGSYNSSNGTDVRTSDSSRYLRFENSNPGIRFITWGTNYRKYNPVRLVKTLT